MDADALGVRTDGPATPAGRELLWRGVRRNRGMLLVATSQLSMHQLCEVAVPVLIGVIIDSVIAPGDTVALAGWLGVLAAVFVVLTVSYRSGALRAMTAAQQQAHRLRMECAQAALDDESAADGPGRAQRREASPAGEVLSVANSDADETGNVLRYLPQTVAALVALAACAVALFVVDVLLGVIVVVGTPLILSMVGLVAPLVTRRVAAQQRHIGHATALAGDLITGLRTLCGINAQDVAAQRYRDADGLAHRAMRRAATGHGAFFGTATGVTGMLAVAVAGLTGWFALTDRISVGALIAVLGIAQFLTEPLAVVAMFPGRWATAQASAARVAAVVETQSAPAGKRTDEPALVVRKGEFVVVRTDSPGAAQRIVDQLRGRSPRDVLVEPHVVNLFGGTLGENLSVGPAALDPAAVVELLTSLGCGDIIDAAPDDPLQMELTDRGLSLSGGQRQRIALARALLTNPSVLVLHDPTTAVDSITERTIVAAVRRHRHAGGRARTTIAITNSPGWAGLADRVVDFGLPRASGGCRDDLAVPGRAASTPGGTR